MPTPTQLPPGSPINRQMTEKEAQVTRRILIEIANRKIEGLRLYEPLPHQEAFHSSKCREKVVRGSNRAGKTLCSAVEVARAVTGQDPHNKYPKNDGIWYCVGKDGRQVGQIMWKKLARPGSYRMIRDLATGQWRAFRPNDAGDEARAHEAKPAPPLIPRRLIKEISWENKKEGLPKIVRLTNGWEMHFFSSLGKPPQGSDINGAWFDEEIVDADWYPEIAARLVDRRGHFVWSATPQSGTDELYSLHERAERQVETGVPVEERTIEEFVMLIGENRFMTPMQIKEFVDKLTDEERNVRIGGEFAMMSAKVFPEYDRETHDVDYFQIPPDWTRYASVDPGRQVCAVLFGAVPPPDMGDFFYLYDELYIRNCDAEMFGERMAEKVGGQTIYQMLIDHQQSRVTEMGSGLSIESQYSRALAKRKIACSLTGSAFTWGVADPRAGVEACRPWFSIRSDGKCKLRVMRDKVPNFIAEIKKYRYKRTRGVIMEIPEDRGFVHQMANFRYLVQSNPKWVRPREGHVALSGAYKRLLDKKKKNQGDDAGVLKLGP